MSRTKDYINRVNTVASLSSRPCFFKARHFSPVQDFPIPPVVALAYLVLDQFEVDHLHRPKPLDANLEDALPVIAQFGPDVCLEDLDPLPLLRQPPFAARCNGGLVEEGPDLVLVALEDSEGDDVDN